MGGPDDRASVIFTPEKLRRFKRALSRARERQQETGADVFAFEGNDYVIGYARYLVEYLERVLGRTFRPGLVGLR